MAAAAAPAASTMHFATTITPLQENSPYTGSLDLTVDADGTLRGYYFPSDYSALYVPVVGGRTGEAIWFDIGTDKIVRVEGRLHDGRIDGGAIDESNMASYAFAATPSTQTR